MQPANTSSALRLPNLIQNKVIHQIPPFETLPLVLHQQEFLLLPHTREAKRGVKQLVHFVCLSVYKHQFMIEEQLDLNQVLYFEHGSENERVV